MLIGTIEAAKIMGTSDAHVRRLIGQKKLPAQRIGNKSWAIHKEDAENYIFPKKGRKRKILNTEQLNF